MPIKRLAIIPARGGSKRILRKNIRPFGGKPMISHILETAKGSELFDTIHVSTEDAEIIEIVNGLGFMVDFIRPENLSDDFASVQEVLEYVLATYNERSVKFDEVWLLAACAPLIEISDLWSAAQIFAEQKGIRKAVLAVTEYPAPVEWAFHLDEKKTLKPLEKDKHFIRSQDIETAYYDSGTFIIFPAEYLLNPTNVSIEDKFLGYVLPKLKGIDIDTEDDWTFAETVFKLNKGHFISK